MTKLYGIFHNMNNEWRRDMGVFTNIEDAEQKIRFFWNGHSVDYPLFHVREIKKSDIIEFVLNQTKDDIEMMRKYVFADFQHDYLSDASSDYITTLRSFYSYFKTMESEP